MSQVIPRVNPARPGNHLESWVPARGRRLSESDLGDMMLNRNSVRRTMMAVAAVSAATVLTTGCQPGDEYEVAAPTPANTPSASAATDAPAEAPGSGTTDPSASGDEGASSPAKDTGTAPTCTSTALKADARQAADRPAGTGIGAMVVKFTNTSAERCVVQGHPTVAGAANGSPERNAPLTVTRTGTATPVSLAPGASAWVKLTFVQIQGEADGYCESGSDPIDYPTVVVGLPGSGLHQVAPEDVGIGLCDNKVTVTPATATEPS